MSRRSIYLSIPEPCHEGWENMDATERGAFCHSCQKEVIDFSAMTDREVIEYLEKHKAGCGRFWTDQLNRKLAMPRHSNGLFRWRALVFSLLPLLAFENVKAVTANTYVTDQNNQKQNNQKGTTPQTIKVSGIIENESGAPLADAVVALTDSSGTYTGKSVFTDRNGYFVFFLNKHDVMNSKMKLKISYSGYLSEIQDLTNESNQHYLICMGERGVDVIALPYKRRLAVEGLMVEAPPTRVPPINLVYEFCEETPVYKHKALNWFRRLFGIKKRS